MKKGLFRNRRAKYGWMTLLLTVLLIATVVLANVLFSTLAERYSWYASLRGEVSYSVSDSCYSLLGAALAGQNADVNIIFCNTKENIEADATTSYVYKTATELASRFPEQVRVTCHNIHLNPNSVRQYGETLDPTTGETVEIPIATTCVIITNGDYHRVYNLTEFFVFAEGDTSQLWAYNGEKKLAAGILHAVGNDKPMACFTNNHGEVYYDYELLYLLDDAGYEVRYLDLYKDPIPEECTLLVSYNPNSDLTAADEVSATSEIDTVNAFLSKSGNAFLVFLGNSTPKLENYESFLADWGVETMYYKNSATGAAYRYTVQNSAQSLTSDGYTVYGAAANSGRAGELVKDLTRATVFQNATALRASNGFVSNGDGSYTKGNRTFHSLYEAGEGSVCWANGKAVSDEKASLLTLTEQQNADAGSSYVMVCSSVNYGTEDFLQSAVYGNTDTMMHAFGIFGKTNIPEGLTIKPFESTKISTVTTSQMWTWTLVLAILPAVVTTGVAVVYLVRRRRA